MIFLSYVRENAELARALFAALERLGLRVWMDTCRLRGGDDWRLEIEEAIAACDLFVVLVSRESNATHESPYLGEIRQALRRARDLRPGRAFAVPVQIDDAPLTGSLAQLQSLSVYTDDTASIATAAGRIAALAGGGPAASRDVDPIDEICRKVLSSPPLRPTAPDLSEQIMQRVNSIQRSIELTLTTHPGAIEETVGHFKDWMLNGAVVRVLGAGRARLAGAIPANRLAHGGAQVFVQGDIIPMPHTIKNGGVVAVSASGRTDAVLAALRDIRRKNPSISIVGIADGEAEDFAGLCDTFIGIVPSDTRNPLEALADTNEYVCSMILDALVVAAGNRAGFDSTTWRLGHENIGDTGPYDVPDDL